MKKVADRICSVRHFDIDFSADIHLSSPHGPRHLANPSLHVSNPHLLLANPSRRPSNLRRAIHSCGSRNPLLPERLNRGSRILCSSRMLLLKL